MRLLQEEIFAVVNERTNRTLFVLTVVTVFALPMTIIPGPLGMNVGSVPLQRAGGFWIAVGLIVGFTAIAAFIAFRRRIDL